MKDIYGFHGWYISPSTVHFCPMHIKIVRDWLACQKNMSCHAISPSVRVRDWDATGSNTAHQQLKINLQPMIPARTEEALQYIVPRWHRPCRLYQWTQLFESVFPHGQILPIHLSWSWYLELPTTHKLCKSTEHGKIKNDDSTMKCFACRRGYRFLCPSPSPD